MHVHTNHSDGTDSPAYVVERAVKAGVSALAVTDHDTISGLKEAASAAAETGTLEFLRGVELSVDFEGMGLHVVGLGVDPDCEELVSTLSRVELDRASRAQAIMRRLSELGVPVNPDKVSARAAGPIGRLHIAQEIHAEGHVRTVQQAFDKYIGRGKPAFCKIDRISCADAVDLIHGAGGLAFVGHPGLDSVHKKVEHLLRLPFDGIEAYHSAHSAGEIEKFVQIANEHKVLISGGSDCHGKAKAQSLLGTVRLPYRYFEAIKAAL